MTFTLHTFTFELSRAHLFIALDGRFGFFLSTDGELVVDNGKPS